MFIMASHQSIQHVDMCKVQLASKERRLNGQCITIMPGKGNSAGEPNEKNGGSGAEKYESSSTACSSTVNVEEMECADWKFRHRKLVGLKDIVRVWLSILNKSKYGTADEADGCSFSRVLSSSSTVPMTSTTTSTAPIDRVKQDILHPTFADIARRSSNYASVSSAVDSRSSQTNFTSVVSADVHGSIKNRGLTECSLKGATATHNQMNLIPKGNNNNNNNNTNNRNNNTSNASHSKAAKKTSAGFAQEGPTIRTSEDAVKYLHQFGLEESEPAIRREVEELYQSLEALSAHAPSPSCAADDTLSSGVTRQRASEEVPTACSILKAQRNEAYVGERWECALQSLLHLHGLARNKALFRAAVREIMGLNNFFPQDQSTTHHYSTPESDAAGCQMKEKKKPKKSPVCQKGSSDRSREVAVMATPSAKQGGALSTSCGKKTTSAASSADASTRALTANASVVKKSDHGEEDQDPHGFPQEERASSLSSLLSDASSKSSSNTDGENLPHQASVCEMTNEERTRVSPLTDQIKPPTPPFTTSATTPALIGTRSSNASLHVGAAPYQPTEMLMEKLASAAAAAAAAAAAVAEEKQRSSPILAPGRSPFLSSAYPPFGSMVPVNLGPPSLNAAPSNTVPTSSNPSFNYSPSTSREFKDGGDKLGGCTRTSPSPPLSSARGGRREEVDEAADPPSYRKAAGDHHPSGSGSSSSSRSNNSTANQSESRPVAEGKEGAGEKTASMVEVPPSMTMTKPSGSLDHSHHISSGSTNAPSPSSLPPSSSSPSAEGGTAATKMLSSTNQKTIPSSGKTYHLESKEDMIRRRNAAPAAFYNVLHTGNTPCHRGGGSMGVGDSNAASSALAAAAAAASAVSSRLHGSASAARQISGRHTSSLLHAPANNSVNPPLFNSYGFSYPYPTHTLSNNTTTNNSSGGGSGSSELAMRTSPVLSSSSNNVVAPADMAAYSSPLTVGPDVDTSSNCASPASAYSSYGSPAQHAGGEGFLGSNLYRLRTDLVEDSDAKKTPPKIGSASTGPVVHSSHLFASSGMTTGNAFPFPRSPRPTLSPSTGEVGPSPSSTSSPNRGVGLSSNPSDSNSSSNNYHTVLATAKPSTASSPTLSCKPPPNHHRSSPALLSTTISPQLASASSHLTTPPQRYAVGGGTIPSGNSSPNLLASSLSSSSSTGGSSLLRSGCPYDYLLVLDFEATCEEYPPPSYVYEIIEFPVVLVDAQLGRPMAEFHSYVRPREKPILSDFCRKLTGISQEKIDRAPSLEEVVRQFERWCFHTLPPNTSAVFATDGSMDLQCFMYLNGVCRLGYSFPSLFYQWIDVKQIFSTFFQCPPGKIKAMLDVLHRPFEGRLHSGIDDARNISNIVIGLLQWGSSLTEVPLCHVNAQQPTQCSSPTPSFFQASPTGVCADRSNEDSFVESIQNTNMNNAQFCNNHTSDTKNNNRDADRNTDQEKSDTTQGDYQTNSFIVSVPSATVGSNHSHKNKNKNVHKNGMKKEKDIEPSKKHVSPSALVSVSVEPDDASNSPCGTSATWNPASRSAHLVKNGLPPPLSIGPPALGHED